MCACVCAWVGERASKCSCVYLYEGEGVSVLVCACLFGNMCARVVRLSKYASTGMCVHGNVCTPRYVCAC